jgi:predicted  nucleic acid-binding Zn-ribbon protein
VSTNGHDPNTAKMVDLLGQIMGELKSMRTDLSTLHEDHLALRAEVVGVKNELSGLRSEIRADLADHEERIRRLERGAA